MNKSREQQIYQDLETLKNFINDMFGLGDGHEEAYNSIMSRWKSLNRNVRAEIRLRKTLQGG